MPTSFTSYWGSSLHGVNIMWTNDITDVTPTLTFVYTANYYWRMPYWYSGLITADVDMANSVGTAYGNDLDENDFVTNNGYANGLYLTTTNRDQFNMQFFIVPSPVGSNRRAPGLLRRRRGRRYGSIQR